MLLAWLLVMSLPATLTREGLPHALRTIGMIPPVMILAGFGAWAAVRKIAAWLKTQKNRWPQYENQLTRIGWEAGAFLALLLVFMPILTYRAYFIKWAHNAHAYDAFSANYVHIGQYLRTLPREVRKYVLVNASGVEVRGVPMPAQTVMFLTDTFRAERQRAKNIVYIVTKESLAVVSAENSVIMLLNGFDTEAIDFFKQKLPGFVIKTPGDFLTFENY